MACLRVNQVNKVESNDVIRNRYCLCPFANDDKLWVYEILLDDKKIGWASVRMRSDSEWERHTSFSVRIEANGFGILQYGDRVTWYNEYQASEMVVPIVNKVMESLNRNSRVVTKWYYGTRVFRPEIPIQAPPADLSRWKTAILV